MKEVSRNQVSKITQVMMPAESIMFLETHRSKSIMGNRSGAVLREFDIETQDVNGSFKWGHGRPYTNFIMVDGHAEFLSLEETYDGYGTGSYNITGSLWDCQRTEN